MRSLHEKIMSNDIWRISGNFGCINSNELSVESDLYELKADLTSDENGVYHVKGNFKNLTDETMSLDRMKMKFDLGGGEFEVYTQYNGWENESTGTWQELVTEISASNRSVRSAFGAAPFIGIMNRQTGRGIVFHLLASYMWEIRVRREPLSGDLSTVTVELGMSSDGLSLKIEPERSIATPEIIFYEFTERIDLDAWKLHKYFLSNYKRKQMPVIYNTWLSNFDYINFENINAQIPKARELGIEYFVIDAGWFGCGGNWYKSRGDWYENENGLLCGKLGELADNVRANGMKFGLWFEIESADKNSDIVRTHPEYFIVYNDSYLLDFSKKEACEHILTVLLHNVEKYGIEFIKFDFNQDMKYDTLRGAYSEYFKGYRAVISAFKEKHPEVYLENCSSGGYRVDLENAVEFDSFWLSDNQSPYAGMRIFKEDIKRMPPRCIEKWATITSVKNICTHIDRGPDFDNEKIISTHDAVWGNLVGINESYLLGFLTGGPVGISCDLTRFSPSLMNVLKEHIAAFKNERAFWENAVCRILTDTDKLLVLEYISHGEIKLVAYSSAVIMQDKICVYPHVKSDEVYDVNGETIGGRDIVENGIELPISGSLQASFLTLGVLEKRG